MKDSELRQSIIDELEAEPSVDPSDIGVIAEAGVVTLVGHVPSYAQKLTAEKTAWRVRGVKAIAQEIEVRLPSDKRQHDDEIARRALDILAWSAGFPVSTIKVQVEDGMVTLGGKVNWHFERVAAEKAVRQLSGVRGILNAITIAATVMAGDVKERISDMLLRSAEIEASRIQVVVKESGSVTLEGDVDDWSERKAVRRAAWSVAGVTQVNDHLRIRT